MGRVRNKRTRATKNKAYKKSHDTKRRPRDVDQVQDDLLKLEKEQKSKLEFELDDDLPGLGQFYCVTCARHFADQLTLDGHLKAKAHKRRLKDVAQEQYTHLEAELAAGKSKEILPSIQALRELNTNEMDSN